VLAAAHGHLGDAAAATEALAKFLQRTLALTAADERLNRPFGTAAQRQRFLEGLRAAGLPGYERPPLARILCVLMKSNLAGIR
jgi:hypothetical protein